MGEEWRKEERGVRSEATRKKGKMQNSIAKDEEIKRTEKMKEVSK